MSGSAIEVRVDQQGDPAADTVGGYALRPMGATPEADLRLLKRVFDGLPHPVSVRRADDVELLMTNAAYQRLIDGAAPDDRDHAEQRLRFADLVTARTHQSMITEQVLPGSDGERHYVGHSTLIAGVGLSPDLVCTVWTDIEDHVHQIRSLRQQLAQDGGSRPSLYC